MKRQDTRRILLNAAEQIVLKEGAARLTLDAVALKAGVSKGGVIYHFSGKSALIEAMIADLIARFEADHAREAARTSPTPGAWTRAYVRATFPLAPSPEPDPSVALLAAISTEPELLCAFRDKLSEWQSQAEAEGLDPVTATVVRLATDGLWLYELLGLSPLTEERRRQVIERLLDMADPVSEGEMR